jgi:hypothetical protein
MMGEPTESQKPETDIAEQEHRAVNERHEAVVVQVEHMKMATRFIEARYPTVCETSEPHGLPTKRIR